MKSSPKYRCRHRLRGVKSSFIKFTIRKSIDFPIVNCAAMIGKGDARICLNAVHNKPYRVLKAEELVRGKSINEKIADAAGAAAVANARALPGDRNKWKIQIAQDHGQKGHTGLRLSRYLQHNRGTFL